MLSFQQLTKSVKKMICYILQDVQSLEKLECMEKTIHYYFKTHISHPPNENREDFFVPMSNESLTHKESEGVFLS
jgi:hypothetical protein